MLLDKVFFFCFLFFLLFSNSAHCNSNVIIKTPQKVKALDPQILVLKGEIESQKLFFEQRINQQESILKKINDDNEEHLQNQKNWDFAYKIIYLILVAINLFFVIVAWKDRRKDRLLVVKSIWIKELVISYGLKEVIAFFEEVEKSFTQDGGAQEKISNFKKSKRIFRSKFVGLIEFLSTSELKNVELMIENVEDYFTEKIDEASSDTSDFYIYMSDQKSNILKLLYEFHYSVERQEVVVSSKK